MSISRSWVDCIVTEYGVACLKGASIRQRVDMQNFPANATVPVKRFPFLR